MLLAGFLGRKPTGIFTVAMIISFVLIAGTSASVVRAAIMALLVIAAQLCGRMYTSVYAVVWAAGLMTLQNPRIVVWDVGFQLSVLATLGVLYAFRLRPKSNQSITVFEIARPTIGAIIATAPLIAFHFKTFSIVAIPANMLLLPLVPWIMLFGALSFLPWIGAGFALIAQGLTRGMLWGVMRFASLPYSSVNAPLSPTQLIIFYLLLLVSINALLQYRKKQELFQTTKYVKM